MNFPEPFKSALKQIEKLQEEERYISAYIFGSLARGEQDKNSDLDVMVIVDTDNECTEINHPILNGLKSDLTFRSFEQIKKMNEDILKKNERIPFVAESVIVSDKTGELTKL